MGKAKNISQSTRTGIADKLIQDALSQIPLEDYKKTATTLAQKKKTSLGSSDAEAIILIVKEKAKFFGAPPHVIILSQAIKNQSCQNLIYQKKSASSFCKL